MNHHFLRHIEEDNSNEITNYESESMCFGNEDQSLDESFKELFDQKNTHKLALLQRKKKVWNPFSHIHTQLKDDMNQVMKLSEEVKGKDSETNEKCKRETIAKHPFNGASPYLISRILLIGYEKHNLKKLIYIKNRISHSDSSIESNSKEDSSVLPGDNSKYYLIVNEKPVVLGAFGSEYTASKESHNKMVIDQVYPNEPRIYRAEGQMCTTASCNVVFSITFASESNALIRQTYYGYLYYKKTSINGETYYCPRALCIQSNYPFFSNYLTLCKYYTDKLTLKYLSELWLYHLVNLPAPINSPYQLFYFPSSEINIVKPMLFTQLSGYPSMQFRLPELFNILPVELIIEIFIFTFLEIDMLFFAESLEVLNIVMYIFASLNYPLNDSSYYYNIVSVSLDTFKHGIDPFVTKTHATMLGVNESYDPSHDKHIRKACAFIVDIEKKSLHFIKKDAIDLKFKDSVASRNHKLLLYIKKLMLEANPQSNYFEIAFSALYSDLNTLSLLITQKNIAGISSRFDFFKLTDLNYDSFSVTKTVQEKFFSFTVKVLSHYHSFNNFELPCSMIKYFHISYYDNKANTKDQEGGIVLFTRAFKESAKFKSFIVSFIHKNDSFSLWQVPLLFTEELINQYIASQRTISLCDTIDDFYHIHNTISLVINLDAFFNSLSCSLASSHHSKSMLKGLDPNAIYSNHLIDCMRLDHNSSKKSKTAKKKHPIDLYEYFYLNGRDKDAFKFQYKFKLKCDKLYQLTQRITVFSNHQCNLLDKSTDLRYVFSKKKNLVVNEAQRQYVAFISKAVSERAMVEGQMSVNDVVYCSFIMLFIIVRGNDGKDSLCQFRLIADLFLKHQHVYCNRNYITALVMLLVFDIMRKAVDTPKGDDDDAENNEVDEEEEKDDESDTRKCLVEAIWLIKELNLIANEELMVCLNTSYFNKYLTMKEVAANRNDYFIEESYKGASYAPDQQGKNRMWYKSYLQYNIGFKGTYKEDYFIQLAQNINYNGNLYIEEQEKEKERESSRLDNFKRSLSICKSSVANTTFNSDTSLLKKNEKVCWNIAYDRKKYSTPIYSPIKMFEKLKRIYNHSIIKGKELRDESKKELIRICCLLIFYIKNIKFIFGQAKVCSNASVRSYEAEEYCIFLCEMIDKINQFN